MLPFLVLKHSEDAFKYKTRTGDFHSRGRYLYVATVFMLLREALKLAERLPADLDRLGPQHIRVVRDFFVQRELSLALLQLAESVMANFFDDSTIEKQVGQDMFAFLKQHVEKPAAWNILENKATKALTTVAAGKALVLDVRNAVLPKP